MKRLLIAIVISLVLASFATPVFAQDPPDTEVVVVVTTPGDVDLDVGINAGGDVDITVDGYDFDETARMAYQAYMDSRATGEGSINTADWYNYFNKEMKVYNQVLAGMDNTLGILANAEAKLMQGQDLTAVEIRAVNSALADWKLEVGGSLADVDSAIASIKAQEEKTWNQLMYGAEAHIALLDGRLAETQQDLDALAIKTQNERDIADCNYTNLFNQTEYLRVQYLYYFWIMGGVIVVLAGLLGWSLLRSRG